MPTTPRIQDMLMRVMSAIAITFRLDTRRLSATCHFDYFRHYYAITFDVF